jgi:CheY-like chemotaxis protein
MADPAPERARIFMAEDNPGDVTLMRAAVDEVGLAADIKVAPDGAQALERLLDPAHRAPDLIILNFNLPKLQGHEVLSTIKQTPRLLGVPVVMLTSSTAQRDRLLCATADAFFVKSGDWDGLLRIVRHLKALIEAMPSRRPTTQSRLQDDGFWQQGALGPQGSGLDPIADLKLTKATERKRVGEPLDEEESPPPPG